MGRPSALTPYGLYRFGAAPSTAEKIYKAQVAQLTDPKTGRSPFDLAPGTYQEARLYARSIAVALALTTLERAGNQSDPTKAREGLPEIEADYLVTPGPHDSVPTRRARLAAKKRGHRGGALRWSVIDALRTLLGYALLSYFPSATKTAYTAGPKNGQRKDLPAKFVKLTEPVAPTSVIPRSVGYTNLDATQSEVVLAVGDIVMADPDNSAVSEEITVTAVGGTAGARTATMQFAKPHNVDAIVTTMNWPFEPSASRRHFVVTLPALAADPATRALIDDLMPDIVRAISTWDIVAGSGGTISRFALGTSPLGTAALSDLTYEPTT